MSKIEKQSTAASFNSVNRMLKTVPFCISYYTNYYTIVNYLKLRFLGGFLSHQILKRGATAIAQKRTFIKCAGRFLAVRASRPLARALTSKLLRTEGWKSSFVKMRAAHKALAIERRVFHLRKGKTPANSDAGFIEMADNPYQQANIGFKFTIYAALVGGAVAAIAKQETAALSLITENIDAVLLFIFLALFNLKTYFDDHKHFGELYQCDDLWERGLGIALAILSWLFMSIAAALIYRPADCAAILGISIAVSSLWIIVHLIELRRAEGRPQWQIAIRDLRQNWFLMNTIYIIILTLYVLLPKINGVDFKVYYMLSIALFLLYDMVTGQMTKDLFPKGRDQI